MPNKLQTCDIEACIAHCTEGPASPFVPVAKAQLAALLAEIKRQAAEIASLRLTLGGMPHNADMPEPIGCPMPGACACRAALAEPPG